jgi:hypothetical protein
VNISFRRNPKIPQSGLLADTENKFESRSFHDSDALADMDRFMKKKLG